MGYLRSFLTLIGIIILSVGTLDASTRTITLVPSFTSPLSSWGSLTEAHLLNEAALRYAQEQADQVFSGGICASSCTGGPSHIIAALVGRAGGYVLNENAIQRVYGVNSARVYLFAHQNDTTPATFDILVGSGTGCTFPGNGRVGRFIFINCTAGSARPVLLDQGTSTRSLVLPLQYVDTGATGNINLVIDIRPSNSGRAFVNLLDPVYGVTGDNVTSDTAAIQRAFDAGTGGTIFVPNKTYLLDGNGVLLNGDTRLVFASPNAIFRYTGTVAAVRVDHQKRLVWESGTIDISGAGASAIGIRVRGLWFGTFVQPSVITGGASQEAIHIESSVTGGNQYGAYIIQIINPDLQRGLALYGIRVLSTVGDGNRATHIMIRGGWISGKTAGISFDTVFGGTIEGVAIDSGVDAIAISNSRGISIDLGETSGTGYGVNYGTGNAQQFLRATNDTGVMGLGAYNSTNMTPILYNRNQVRLYGSSSDQTYYLDIRSLFSYPKSFSMSVRGGGLPEREIFSWGEGSPLIIQSGAARVSIDDVVSVGTFGTVNLVAGDALIVRGPIRLTDSGTQPDCILSRRGMIWQEDGANGVKDNVQVCAKDAGDVYAWRVLY